MGAVRLFLALAVASDHWRNFVLVPLGIVGMILTALRIRGRAVTPSGRAPAAVDYLGSALLVVFTLVLTLLVDQRSANALGVGSKGVMSLALALTLAGFVLQERRAVKLTASPTSPATAPDKEQ